MGCSRSNNTRGSGMPAGLQSNAIFWLKFAQKSEKNLRFFESVRFGLVFKAQRGPGDHGLG